MAFAQSVLKLSGNKKQAYTKVLLKFLLISIDYDYDNADNDNDNYDDDDDNDKLRCRWAQLKALNEDKKALNLSEKVFAKVVK